MLKKMMTKKNEAMPNHLEIKRKPVVAPIFPIQFSTGCPDWRNQFSEKCLSTVSGKSKSRSQVSRYEVKEKAKKIERRIRKSPAIRKCFTVAGLFSFDEFFGGLVGVSASTVFLSRDFFSEIALSRGPDEGTSSLKVLVLNGLPFFDMDGYSPPPPNLLLSSSWWFEHSRMGSRIP